MKKITTILVLFFIGFFGLVNKVKAQSDAILVPTYQNRSEMPTRLSPAKKLLKQLPMVVINENGTDLSLFESEMKLWLVKNQIVKSKLEKSVIDLIDNEQFNDLANILIEMGQSKELSLANNKGGNHE
jgi:hypothetical protein